MIDIPTFTYLPFVFPWSSRWFMWGFLVFASLLDGEFNISDIYKFILWMERISYFCRMCFTATHFSFPFLYILLFIPICNNASPDLANGVKLLILSATRGSSPCFICGLTIFCVATLAIYTSFTYNVAIAMTNTGKNDVLVVLVCSEGKMASRCTGMGKGL